MKSILIGKQKKVESEFPCLKINETNGLTVLFSAPDEGTVVHDPRGADPQTYPLGHYSDEWAMQVFSPLKGKITLCN